MNKLVVRKVISVIVTITTLSSCASMEKSALLGAGIGAALGTGIGLATQSGTGGVLLGAGIGTALGTGMGAMAHKDAEQKDAMIQFFKNRKEFPKDKELPHLKSPEASCYRVPEKVEDEEYLGPQIRCRIEKPAVWSR